MSAQPGTVDLRTLRTRLRSLRESANESQHSLSARAGVSVVTLQKVELATTHDELDTVKVGTLRRLADALGVSVPELYPGLNLKPRPYQ